ncbi:SOS response-associated peptidase family protein [Kribbella antiqua]|uniref:SOS response-associated peptidase family protein n=1 Tax=Kribbella antiqua TaxID=2512217 RepID=UPI003BAE1BBF
MRATFPSALAPTLTTTRGRFCITASFGPLDGEDQIYQRPPTNRAGHIHERMPMTVTPDSWEAWLDPGNNDTDRIRSPMAPCQASGITISKHGLPGQSVLSSSSGRKPAER